MSSISGSYVLCCGGTGVDILAVVVEKWWRWWRQRGEEVVVLEEDANDGPNVRVDASARGVDRSRSDLEAVRMLRLTADMVLCVQLTGAWPGDSVHKMDKGLPPGREIQERETGEGNNSPKEEIFMSGLVEE